MDERNRSTMPMHGAIEEFKRYQIIAYLIQRVIFTTSLILFHNKGEKLWAGKCYITLEKSYIIHTF